jgi:hypothetical protein
MTVPLFDAGLRDAEVKQAEADARIAAERYRSRVLNAVREVQDDVSALRWITDELQQSEAASTAARKALDMSMALYRDGAASYLGRRRVGALPGLEARVNHTTVDGFASLAMTDRSGSTVLTNKQKPQVRNLGLVCLIFLCADQKLTRTPPVTARLLLTKKPLARPPLTFENIAPA